MALNQRSQDLIEEFINTQIDSRSLDERTVKAYRQDLELFFCWLETDEPFFCALSADTVSKSGRDLSDYRWEEKMEAYLAYLSQDRGLRFSTVCRRQLVFSYYLSYLKNQHMIEEFRPLRRPGQERKIPAGPPLSKQEVDTFFYVMEQEYERLDSDFRRRICLRDQVMMGLLFYHGVEISELLRLETSNYNRETAVLTIRRKKERDRCFPLFSKTLQRQMEQWLSEHVYFEHDSLYENRMFLSKLGRPLSMKMVTNIFDKYRVLAGIEKECTPKDLKNGLARYAEETVKLSLMDDM